MAPTYRSGLAVLTLAFLFWLTLAGSAAQVPAELTRAKLEAFVSAATAADRVKAHWAPRIEGAGSEAEAARLQDRANAAMGTAIEQTAGITLDEYRAIYGLARVDPDLAAWLTEAFREQAGR